MLGLLVLGLRIALGGGGTSLLELAGCGGTGLLDRSRTSDGLTGRVSKYVSWSIATGGIMASLEISCGIILPWRPFALTLGLAFNSFSSTLADSALRRSLSFSCLSSFLGEFVRDGVGERRGCRKRGGRQRPVRRPQIA